MQVTTISHAKQILAKKSYHLHSVGTKHYIFNVNGQIVTMCAGADQLKQFVSAFIWRM